MAMQVLRAPIGACIALISISVVIEMQTSQCQICSRLLTDPESVKRGYGPDCAEKRQQTLSAMGINEIELQVWEMDANARRQVELAFKALQRGRQSHAQLFFDTARRMTHN